MGTSKVWGILKKFNDTNWNSHLKSKLPNIKLTEKLLKNNSITMEEPTFTFYFPEEYSRAFNKNEIKIALFEKFRKTKNTFPLTLFNLY